jgi:hypothetical protein
MVKPSLISSKIVQYINSVIWLQSKGIQDPLGNDPIIASKSYPSNIITEYPPESLKMYTKDSRVSEGFGVKQLLCVYTFPFSITWVFNREVYKTYHQIPRSQLANLVTQGLQYLLISPQGIDPEVLDLELVDCEFKVRPAEDVNKQENLNSWSVIAKFSLEVTFISSPDEFVHTDYADIQPGIYSFLEDPIQPEPEFELLGLNIEVNHSDLPSVTPGDDDTFRLDELIILPPES